MRLSLSKPNGQSDINRSWQQHWQDILLVIAIGLIAAILSYQAAQLINPAFIWDKQLGDGWFNNDTTRTFDDMSVYEADHHRTNLHPLIVALTMPIVYLVRTVFSVDPVTAVRLVLAGLTFLWFGSLYLLFRLIRIRRFDAILFTVLAGSSASAMFWFVMPETYPFGSYTLLLGLLLAAVAEYRQLSPLWYVGVGLLTLGITVTNWMVGIIATIVNYPWRKSLVILVQTYLLMVALVIAQKLIFPAFNAGFIKLFLTAGDEAESTTSGTEALYGGALNQIKCFIFDTIVLPKINLLDNQFAIGSKMSVALSPPGSATVWGSVAVVLWIALFSLGLWALFTLKQNRKFRLILGLSLLGQLALEMLYGDERFVHSIHFLPFLIVVAALSTLTKARVLALVLAAALVVSAGVNNTLQFAKAIDYSYGRGVLCAPATAKCNVQNTTFPK